MWRWLLLGLSVHWNTIISQPITNDHERTQPTECCPCPKDHVTTVSDQRFLSDEENATLSENFANIETSFDRENNSNSNDQFLLRDPSGTYADAPNGIMDDCPCRVRDADTVGSPSKFIPSTVNDIWTDVSSKEKKEDIKPLLHPEVDLASSVLETLREATDEEYNDALVRDAAKNAMREDDSIESNVKSALDTAKNIVNLIINPKQEADVQDDVIQEESHTHESRCIHPLSKFNIMTKEPITKPSNLLSELYYLPKMKPLFHKKNLDMDNSVGASNVNEHVVSSSNVKNNLNLKSNPSLFNLYSDDGHKEDTDLFKESNKSQPNILTLFKNEIANVKPYPTLKQIIASNDINKDADNSLLAIQKPNRNNIDSKFKLKSLLPISGLTVTTMKPFNLKNLLKLKDVELISPSKIVKTETENVKGNIPQLLPVLEETNLFKDFESSSLGDFIRNELNLNINALKKNNQLNNYKDETNDLNQSNNVQIIPNFNRKTEIMDVMSSPSEEKITWNNNNVKEEENCKVQKIDDTNTKRIPKVISSQNSISKINIEPERNKFNEPVQFTKITQILDALPSASEDKIRIVTNSNPDMNDSETQVTDSEEIIVNNGLNNEEGDNDNVNNEGNDDNSNDDTTTETEFSDLTEEDSLDQTINEDLQPQITENMNFVDNIINDGTNSESDLSINVESRELYDEENKSADCEDFGDKDEIDGLKSRNSIQTKEDYLDQTENKEDLQSQTSQNAEVVDSNINSRENSESDLSLNFESEESYDEENRSVDSKDFSDEDEMDGLKSRNSIQIKKDCLDQTVNKEDLQSQTNQNSKVVDNNINNRENSDSDFSLYFEPEESYDEENRSVDSKDFSEEDEIDGLKSRNSIQINEDCLDHTENKEDLQPQTSQNVEIVGSNINNQGNRASDLSLNFEPEELYDEENRSVDSKDFSDEDEMDGLKSRNSIQIKENCLEQSENKEDLHPQTSQNVEVVNNINNNGENFDLSLNIKSRESYDNDNGSVDSKNFSYEDEKDIPRTDLFNKMISELLSLKESISKTLNDMKKSMKHSNISVEQDKVESANDNKKNSEVYKVNRDNDIEKSKNDSNSFIRTLDNNDENANNINSQELQNMSDNLLHLSTRNDQEPLGTQTIECTEAIADSSIESNEFGASINTLTKSTEVFDESAENKSIESTTESQITPVTEIIDSNTDFISNTMKGHEADSENSCLDRNIGINTDKNNEMTAEGSHPVGNTITTDNTLFPNIFRSNLLDPKLNIGDILNLNLPQSSVIPNIFDKPNNNMDAAEHDNNDCSLMATQANTPFSKTIISPLKPLEDIDLDIFQLNPLIGSQNIFSKLPRLNINSYKAKLAMPKTLGIMPLKLESSVGNNNGIFGASLTMGPKVSLGKIGKEPSILGAHLNNFPTLEDLQESIRENAHNLLYTPLEITSKNVFDDTLRSGQTISDNIRSHTKNAMRDIQQTLETTLKDVKNSDLAVLGDSLSNPHEFLQAVSRTHEDVNDKLKAIHYDLNDRLESIRDRIIDPSLLPSLTLPLPLSQHSGKYSENAIFPSYSERKPVRYLKAKSESWKDKTSLKKSDSKAKLSTPKISSPKRKPPSTKTISDIPLFKGSEVSKLKGAASEPSLVQYPAFKIPHFSLDKKSFPNLLAEPISRFRDSKIPVLSTYKPKSKVKISFSQTTKRPQTLPSLKNKNSYGLPKSKLNTTPVLKKVKLPTLYRESVKNNHRMQSVKSKQRSNFDSNGAASDLTTSVLQPSLNKPNKVKSAIVLNESDYNTRKDLKNSPESLDLVDIPKSRFMNSIFKNRSNQFKKSKLNEDFMRNLNSKLRSTTVLNKLPDTRNTNFFSMGENMPDNSLPSDVLNDIDRSDSISFNTDMTRSASKSNDMIQYKNKPLEENTSYTCRMMCTKKV